MSANVQKVITFAWDADYTCVTHQYPRPLAAEVLEDGRAGKPIIANCSWHSPYNMSIVILGYNLAGETQQFHVSDGSSRILYPEICRIYIIVVGADPDRRP